MITPLDIQNKEFPKVMRGYKEEDVDRFLDMITLDLEKLIQENKRLKENVKYLTGELDRFHKAEGAVLETLNSAKALMGDISVSAEKRAEILLKNAEMDAARMEREALESVKRINDETVSLRNRWDMFKTKYKNLLEAELERFDTISLELFADKEFEDLQPYKEDPKFNIEKNRNNEGTKISQPITNEMSETSHKTITNLRIGDGI